MAFFAGTFQDSSIGTAGNQSATLAESHAATRRGYAAST